MKKSDPLLSVVTINRNNSAGLEKTIASVLEAFKEFKTGEAEYIIIDGNSTDDSKEVIEKAANSREGKKFITYWVSEPDKGIYNAMNKGVSKASGKLINIMNSGDCMIPYSLHGLRELHEENPDAVLYGGMENYENGKFNGKVYAPLHTCLEGVGICHQAIFTPRNLHEKYGLYDESYKICADYDFFVKLYSNGVPFKYIHKMICSYDMDGISANAMEIREAETLKIRKNYGFYVEEKKSPAKILKKIIKAICPYGLLCLFKKGF